MALDVVSFYNGIKREYGPGYIRTPELDLLESATLVTDDGSPIVISHYPVRTGVIPILPLPYTYSLKTMPPNARDVQHSVGLMQAEGEEGARFLEAYSSPFEITRPYERSMAGYPIIEDSRYLYQPYLGDLVRIYALGATILTAADAAAFGILAHSEGAGTGAERVRLLGLHMLRLALDPRLKIDDAFLERCASD